MPKGRLHAPSADKDGIWFKHRGMPLSDLPQREQNTTTGLMLTQPFKSESLAYPPRPPSPYCYKDSKNFKLSNNFSMHDNRHSFQDHGVYFKDGRTTRTLGKQITTPENRQHFTDNHFWKHLGREIVDYDYNTIYSSSFHGRPTTDPVTRRRFPRTHEDGKPGLSRLSTATTSWYREPDVPHKTPTQVLAVTQEPFISRTNWKYSYHGIPKCYPPYDHVEPQAPYPIWLVHGTKKKQPVAKVSD